jgi:hypothetical protein
MMSRKEPTREERILRFVDAMASALVIAENDIREAIDAMELDVADIVARFRRKFISELKLEESYDGEPEKIFHLQADATFHAASIDHAMVKLMQHFQLLIDGGNPKTFRSGEIRIEVER